MESAVGNALNVVGQMMGFFAKEPIVYFVAVALVGAVAGVARKFVPMRKG